MKVLEASAVKVFDRTLFNPPTDAVLWPQCADMHDAEPLDRYSANYPHIAPVMPPKRVILYAVVEENGSLSHVTVIQGATQDMNTAAMEAYLRWHYKPARCGNKPIRVETSMYFDFWR